MLVLLCQRSRYCIGYLRRSNGGSRRRGGSLRYRGRSSEVMGHVGIQTRKVRHTVVSTRNYRYINKMVFTSKRGDYCSLATIESLSSLLAAGARQVMVPSTLRY
jgi:hypothetical protein